MNYSKAYFDTYKNLPEKLALKYNDLALDNHCYLRIALDNLFKAKWDKIIGKPAYKNLNPFQKSQVISLLESYAKDKRLLLEHNRKSLLYRTKHRQW